MAINYTPMAVTTQSTATLAVGDYVARLNTALTANSAWTQVSNLTGVGSQAWNYMAWKNAASGSGLAQDWYLIAAYQGTNLQIYAAEQWSPTQVADVQTITINGAPTGGTYTLQGQNPNASGALFTFAALAYNATALTVQNALQLLYGSGNVLVSGNAGGPYTVTSAGIYAGYAAPLVVSASALTGGTTPNVTIAHTTVGNFPAQSSGLVQYNYAQSYLTTGGLPQAIFNSPAMPLWAATPTTGAPNNYFGGIFAPISSYSGFTNSVVTGITSNTSIYCHFLVYPDHVVLGIGSTASSVRYYYYGGMTSLVANPTVNDPFCVGQISLSLPITSSGSPATSWTRNPLVLTSQLGQNVPSYWSGGGAYITWAAATWAERPTALVANVFNQTAPYYDPLAGGYQLARPLLPQSANVNVQSNAVYMGFRAIPNNVLVSQNAPAGIAQGDTISYNGTSWLWLGVVSSMHVYVDTGS